jgi:hypothetical protein
MADEPAKVREVAWFELFSWLMLTRSVRIALLARVLILGALGLILTALGWWLISWIFSGSTDQDLIQRWYNDSPLWLWESPEFKVPLAVDSAEDILNWATTDLHKTPLELWLYITRPFIEMFRADVSWLEFLFLLLCGIWELFVWGLIGGAITRIAALKFTRDEAPGLVAALRHAASKMPSYSLPPLVALGGAAVFAVQLALLGLLMNWNVIAFLAALAWPFVLMLGLLMAILLIGALIGWPLMWATISVEGTDAFDALSRSYAYTYQRPWRLLWYVLVVAVLAVVSMFVVKLFAATAIALGDWSVDWGLDAYTMTEVVRPADAPADEAIDFPPPVAPDAPDGGLPRPAETESSAGNAPDGEPGMLLRGARRAIGFWKSLMAALAAGYQAGFLWVAAVGVYLLLRRDIDGVQTSEVFVDQDAEFGVPPLTEDAVTGIPDVSTTGPARPADPANPSNLPRGD